VNDNRPVFQPFANTLMVRENSPAPAVILTVEATDRDQGVYGQVRRNTIVINSLSPSPLFSFSLLMTVPDWTRVYYPLKLSKKKGALAQ